jgi:hypothetical protein
MSADGIWTKYRLELEESRLTGETASADYTLLELSGSRPITG